MRTKTQQKINKLLDEGRLRKTRQRLNILRVLAEAARPLKQEQITQKLGKKSPDKATIYRCLERFTEAGIVHKAYLQDNIWHYELADRCTEKQCHPHFTCVNCGGITCMDKATVPIVKGIGKGFILRRQQVRLEGLCPSCRQ